MLIIARGNCHPLVHHQVFKIPQTREHTLNRDMLQNNIELGHGDLVFVKEAKSTVVNQGHPTSIFGKYLFGKRFEM